MKTVKVSTKFQIVIPKDIRERLELKPGEKLQIRFRDGSLYLNRLRPITELRGIAKGMKWKGYDDGVT